MGDEEREIGASDGRRGDTSPGGSKPDEVKGTVTTDTVADDGDAHVIANPTGSDADGTSVKGRAHDPLLLGLSIVGVALGVMAMLVSCAGNAVILRLWDQVDALCVRQSECGRDGLPIGTDDVIDRILDGDSATGDHGTGVGYIGVRAIDNGRGDGATIVDMFLGGAAYDAGLKSDDVIVRFGDTTVTDAATLSDAVRDATPGSVVTVTYVRDGVTLATDVTVGDIADTRDLVGVVRSGSFDGGTRSHVTVG